MNARGPYIALFSAIAYEKLARCNQGTPLLFGEGVFSHKSAAGSTEDGGCCCAHPSKLGRSVDEILNWSSNHTKDVAGLAGVIVARTFSHPYSYYY